MRAARCVAHTQCPVGRRSRREHCESGAAPGTAPRRRGRVAPSSVMLWGTTPSLGAGADGRLREWVRESEARGPLVARGFLVATMWQTVFVVCSGVGAPLLAHKEVACKPVRQRVCLSVCMCAAAGEPGPVSLHAAGLAVTAAVKSRAWLELWQQQHGVLWGSCKSYGRPWRGWCRPFGPDSCVCTRGLARRWAARRGQSHSCQCRRFAEAV